MEDIEFTLDKLLHYARNLISVAHEGVLSQEVWDKIVEAGKNSLQQLQLRHLACSNWWRWRDEDPAGGIYRSRNDWTEVAMIPSLRSLEIQQLNWGEGRSLAQAVSSLPRLERLLISAASRDTTNRLAKSPLNQVFGILFPSQPEGSDQYANCALPTTLKSLALIDNYQS